MSGWTWDLDQLLHGEVLGSRPGPGGEWDCVRALDRTTLYRLRGGRFMRPRGLAPDQLAEVLNDALRRDYSTDEAVEWYVREALRVLDARAVEQEARRMAGRDFRREHRDRDQAKLRELRARQRAARAAARRSRTVTAGDTPSEVAA